MPRFALSVGLLLAVCGLVLGGCNLGAPAATPAPSPTPALPQIDILFPAHNQQVIEGVIFDIDILATDQAQGIARIELRVDGELQQSSESDTGALQDYRVTMNWFAKGLGWHKFEALAYRPDGTSSAAIIALEVIASP